MDKKSLFWRYGHTPVETGLKHRFHGWEHVKIRHEGQVRQFRIQIRVFMRCSLLPIVNPYIRIDHLFLSKYEVFEWCRRTDLNRHTLTGGRF